MIPGNGLKTLIICVSCIWYKCAKEETKKLNYAKCTQKTYTAEIKEVLIAKPQTRILSIHCLHLPTSSLIVSPCLSETQKNTFLYYEEEESGAQKSPSQGQLPFRGAAVILLPQMKISLPKQQCIMERAIDHMTCRSVWASPVQTASQTSHCLAQAAEAFHIVKNKTNNRINH